MIWPFSIIRDLRRSIEMTYDYLGVVREKQVVREHLTKKGGPENSIRKGTGDE